MEPLSVINVVMAAIVGYVGLYHLIIYLRGLRERTNLCFALSCFAITLYDVSSAVQFNTTAAATGQLAQRVSLITLAWVGLFFIWFVVAYVRARRPGWLVWGFSGYFVLCSMSLFVVPDEWILVVNDQSVREVGLAGLYTTTYFAADQGPLTYVQSLVGLVSFGYLFVRLLRHYLRERNSRTLWLLGAMIAFFAGIVNDVLVSAGVYRFLFMIEYSYMLLVLSMTAALTDKAVAYIKTKRELDRVQRRIVQMQKMETIGQLAGGIAHDFNNLLGGIVGNADLLALKLRDDAKLAEYARRILDASARAQDLTAQLLAFSRRGNMDVVPVDLHDVIDKVVGLLEPTIDRRIQLQRKLEAAPSVVQADVSQLQNAILNLAINARDAMPDGGVLTFATTRITLDGTELASVGGPALVGEYIELDVADTGTGIEPEVLAHIFEPFFTTKPVDQGTGLGLAAVYGTVESHRGFVHAVSDPGLGAIFKVFLPLTEAVAAVDAEPHARDIVRGEGLILLVDDEDIIRNIAGSMLRECGYDVVFADNGKEGVELYRRRHRELDLVILDMIMPEMHGRDALREMRSIDADVPVLVASGYARVDQAEAADAAGAQGLIQKPFVLAELSQKVAEILERAAVSDRAR